MLTPVLVWGCALVWSACCYAILRRNERSELERRTNLPAALVCAIVVATGCAAFFLPVPVNASVALACGGLMIASWGDWHTHILWDEIVIGTMMVGAAAMLYGGAGMQSLQGGLLCGALAYALYFGGLAFGRETGFGDVKLAATIGFVLGPVNGLLAIGAGAISWLLAILAWSVFRKVPYATLRLMPIPFGPGLTTGLILSACFLHSSWTLG